MQNFLDQYNANCREYTRRTPIRFLKLAVAFVSAIVLGSLCYAVEWLTGSRVAVLVVLVPGIISILVIWLLFLRRWDAPADSIAAPQSQPQIFFPGRSPAPLAGSSPWAPDGFPSPDVISATAVGQPHTRKDFQPASYAKPAGPVFPSPARPASGRGWGIALLAIGGVLALSCCGGGAVLIGLATSFTGHVNSPQAVRIDDPFADMHLRHQQQFDEMRRRQDEQMRRFDRDSDRFSRGPRW